MFFLNRNEWYQKYRCYYDKTAGVGVKWRFNIINLFSLWQFGWRRREGVRCNWRDGNCNTIQGWELSLMWWVCLIYFHIQVWKQCKSVSFHICWCFDVFQYGLVLYIFLLYVYISNLSHCCAVSDQGPAERTVPKRKVSSPPHSSNGHSPSESSSSPVKKKKKPGAVNSSKDQVQLSLPIQALVQSCMSVIH